MIDRVPRSGMTEQIPHAPMLLISAFSYARFILINNMIAI